MILACTPVELPTSRRRSCRWRAQGRRSGNPHCTCRPPGRWSAWRVGKQSQGCTTRSVGPPRVQVLSHVRRGDVLGTLPAGEMHLSVWRIWQFWTLLLRSDARKPADSVAQAQLALVEAVGVALAFALAGEALALRHFVISGKVTCGQRRLLVQHFIRMHTFRGTHRAWRILLTPEFLACWPPTRSSWGACPADCVVVYDSVDDIQWAPARSKTRPSTRPSVSAISSWCLLERSLAPPMTTTHGSRSSHFAWSGLAPAEQMSTLVCVLSTTVMSTCGGSSFPWKTHLESSISFQHFPHWPFWCNCDLLSILTLSSTIFSLSPRTDSFTPSLSLSLTPAFILVSSLLHQHQKQQDQSSSPNFRPPKNK